MVCWSVGLFVRLYLVLHVKADVRYEVLYGKTDELYEVSDGKT